MSRIFFTTATARVLSAATFAMAALGCGALGGAPQGELPAPAHVVPTTAQVTENPCRYGELDACITLCKSNDIGSCNAVGVLYEYGAEDHERAAAYYLRACSGDYPPACNNLAWLYAVGRGVPRDPPRSLALFSRAYDGYRMACGNGDTVGCIEAAEMLLEGRGVDEDERLALALFETACDRGDKRGCSKAEMLR